WNSNQFQPTTGKSVGKPRRTVPSFVCWFEPTTGKSVGKPRLFLQVELPLPQPTTGKSVGKPRPVPVLAARGSSGQLCGHTMCYPSPRGPEGASTPRAVEV